MANILADLSLRLRANSAELSKGLEQAKNQIKSFKDGISTTSKAMGEAFKSASAEIGGSLNAMTNGLSGMLSSGLEMSRGLVAGITSVKTAFVSTGIGAIILGITTAIAGLVAAFKRSGEAGDAMAEVFAGLRGVVDFLIGKLVDLGEWIVKAFQSEQMQKFGEVLKNIGTRFGGFFKMVIGGFQTIINSALGASFAISGIFDKENRAKALEYFEKVKDGYDKIAEGAKQLWTGINETPPGPSPLAQAFKEGKELEKLRDKLQDDQRDWTSQNIADERRISEIRAEIAKTGNRTEEDRQKRIELANKALAIQNGINKRNITLAKRNLDITKRELALKNDTSDAAKDQLSAAEDAVELARKAGADKARELEAQKTAAQDALDSAKEKNKEEKKTVELLRQEADEAYRLKTTFDGQRDALKKLWEEGKIGAKEYQDELKKIDENEKVKKLEESINNITKDLDRQYKLNINTDDLDKIIALNIGEKLNIEGKVSIDLSQSEDQLKDYVANGKAFTDALISQFNTISSVSKDAFEPLQRIVVDFYDGINKKSKETTMIRMQEIADQYDAQEAAFKEETKGFSAANVIKMRYVEDFKNANIKSDKELAEYKKTLSAEEYAIIVEDNNKKIQAYTSAKEQVVKLANEEFTSMWEKRSEYVQLVSDSINVIRDLTEAAYNSEVAQAKKRGASEEELEKIRVKYAKKQKGIAIAQALINGALAVTNLLASVPGSVINPATWAGIAVAGATTAAQVALIASQPLAKGGIAYGETLATIGEYPGAQSNPEVVAPLDKLQTILSKVIAENEFIDDNTFTQKNLKRAFSQSLPRTRQIYGPAKRAANMSDNVPKFANGGLVSGPTVGIVGEYPGAQSNPEIMMPLKTIGSMLAKSISTSIFNAGDTRSIESTLDTEDNNTYISNSSRNLRGLNIPKFASGGIVYGETLATVGEYAGAINNPEVIAPLSKLKDMITPLTPDFGDVKFVIEQNQLVGILSKANDKNIYF